MNNENVLLSLYLYITYFDVDTFVKLKKLLRTERRLAKIWANGVTIKSSPPWLHEEKFKTLLKTILHTFCNQAWFFFHFFFWKAKILVRWRNIKNVLISKRWERQWRQYNNAISFAFRFIFWTEPKTKRIKRIYCILIVWHLKQKPFS